MYMTCDFRESQIKETAVHFKESSRPADSGQASIIREEEAQWKRSHARMLPSATARSPFDSVETFQMLTCHPMDFSNETFR